MQKITPFLWFDHEAEEAMKFYVAIFKNSKIIGVTRYTEAGPGPKGSVMTANFVLNGQEIVALNGGPIYKLTPAFSLAVMCDTAEEVDYYWEKLTEGGSAQQCGWLTDKFGVTWQIVPIEFIEMMKDADDARSKRLMQAMMPMTKLDIAKLKQAYEGK